MRTSAFHFHYGPTKYAQSLNVKQVTSPFEVNSFSFSSHSCDRTDDRHCPRPVQKRYEGCLFVAKTVKDWEMEMATAGVWSWSTCIEPFIFYNQHWIIFKTLKTLVDGFSPNRERFRYLDGYILHLPAASVPTAVYRPPEHMDAALWCLAAFMVK